MPELPEVETIRRQLAPHLEGRTILRAELLDARWTRPSRPEPIARQLAGATVKSVERSGKYLILALSSEMHLLVHLRMTGSLLFDPVVPSPHTRALFHLDGDHLLTYADPRRFGTAHLLHGRGAREAYLAARLGPEPFSDEFTAAYLRLAARGRLAPVKAFILDQRRVAGVGNIYADEALYRAGVHPLRPAGRLNSAQWEALRDAIRAALEAGIEAKGATIDDFRHVDGARGSFQDRFLVHRREGKACSRCGTVIRKLVVGGRGTYVCERCQPRPRRLTVRPRADPAADPADRRAAGRQSHRSSVPRSRSGGR